MKMQDDFSVDRAAAPSGRRTLPFTLPIGVTDEDGQVRRDGALRKMTGREEAILADAQNQRNGAKLVTELLSGCITELGGQPVSTATVANMYSADRNYLLLRLRAITFGPALEASYKCPSCGHGWDVTEDLDELPVKMLAEGERVDTVPVELEDGYVDKAGNLQTAMVLRLPTGADESAVAAQMRKNASLGKNALLARCMVALGDVPAHRLEALGPKILVDLTMTDRRLIDRALNSGAPGVDLIRPIECPACGNEFKANLDLSRFLAVE
ncbi:MAG: hypothetical protein B7Y45_03010 [Sphingomonas sp. 28-66-16]|nr:MAG: hypothetical protein B7Y45_03010 [Sphingomonas sp. 28-66-16]